MKIDLKGKIALVCGAGDGIGKAVAHSLHEAGAEIIALSRTASKIDASVCSEIIELDMADTMKLRQAVNNLLQYRSAIHIIVHNTGGPAPGPILQAKEEDFLIAFHQHVLSAQVLASLIIPGMAEVRYGRIINIVSTSVKAPLKGLGVSNTIRGAMSSWAKTLSNEWAAYGITINNVLPGATLTQRLRDIIHQKAIETGKTEIEIQKHLLSEIPAGRFAEPKEPASLVTFLASEYAGYITGTSIPVDGGRTPCF